MSCAVVCPAIWVTHSMCELVFDVVGTKAKHLIQDRTSHCTKPVTGHRLRVEPHPPQRGINSVIAHRPAFSMKARKDELAAPGNRLKLTKDFDGLRGKRDNMRSPCLGRDVPPLSGNKIDIFPFGVPQFARARENQGRKLESGAYNRASFVSPQGPQQGRHGSRLGQAGEFCTFGVSSAPSTR